MPEYANIKTVRFHTEKRAVLLAAMSRSPGLPETLANVYNLGVCR